MIATKTPKKSNASPSPAGRALIRAAKAARATARMYGTPVYVRKDGKIVALKP